MGIQRRLADARHSAVKTVTAVLSLTDAAELIGRSPDYLRRRWQELARRYGFPQPLRGRPLRWSRAALQAWVDHDQLRKPAPPPANDSADPALRDLVRRRVAEMVEPA